MQTLILTSTLALSLLFAVAAAELVLSLVLWLAAKGTLTADSAVHGQPGITAVQSCGEPQS